MLKSKTEYEMMVEMLLHNGFVFDRYFWEESSDTDDVTIHVSSDKNKKKLSTDCLTDFTISFDFGSKGKGLIGIDISEGNYPK